MKETFFISQTMLIGAHINEPMNQELHDIGEIDHCWRTIAGLTQPKENISVATFMTIST